MSKKNKIIISLIAVATILFCIIQFCIIPANQSKQVEYAKNQEDALTHDISTIKPFKNPYIGNASNVSNLFYTLPLNQISMKFQINSESHSVTITYLDTIRNIGEEKVHRDLVYNSVASMAAIDNLNTITYEFSDGNFSFNREQFETVFGAPLSDLLDKDVWNKKVKTQISAIDFIQQFYLIQG